MLETTTLSDEAIMRGLNANPQIKHRMASLLAAVEDAAEDLKEADAAQMRMIKCVFHAIVTATAKGGSRRTDVGALPLLSARALLF